MMRVSPESNMYYNQNNYASVPYPSAGNPTATVKTGGCGVCCASMIVEGLTGKTWPPEESAKYAIKAGARITGGTDMERLASCIAKDYGLSFKTTDDLSALIAHLPTGMAVINVGGDRSGYTGLFSDGGHYITATGLNNGKIVIYDPGYYPGKFSKAGRGGKVSIAGNEITVSPALLDKDAENRSPRYYLFKKEEDEMMRIISQIASAAGLSEEDTIQALSVLAKYANTTEEAWEKDGAAYLKDTGLLSAERDGRELVEFGELGVILKRFKESLTK